MGRIRRAAQVDDKENGGQTGGMFGASVRFSRPWDNSSKQCRDIESTRYSSLRVEHFVNSNIASRAAVFENGNIDDSLPRSVVDLANKFEAKPSPSRDTIRPGSVVIPWPDTPLQESITLNPNPRVNPTSFDSESSPCPVANPKIKTQLGRRSVKPLLRDAKPPPLVGLPIPSKGSSLTLSKITSDQTQVSENSESMASSSSCMSPSPSKNSAIPMRTPTATTPVSAQIDAVCPSPLPSRGSTRCSVRAPPLLSSGSRRASSQSIRLSPGQLRSSSRMSSRHSVRMSGARQIPREFSEVPTSSFLAFDENARLSFQSPKTGVPTSIVDSPAVPEGQREYLDFSDPDTFDTFGSLHSDDEGGDKLSLTELQTPEREIGRLPGLSQSGSEKAEFPEMPYLHTGGKSGAEEEDDGDVLDVPKDMMTSSTGGKALRELQCASVTAGNELAEQVRQYAAQSDAKKEARVSTKPEARKADKISRAQGELELRSRFFRRWNTRYASIVDHPFFGAVLFLFRHDSKASRSGTIALKNSKMIVLADSTVRELDGFRKNGPSSLFELKTTQRKYVFACLDETQRKYWLENLTSYSA